MTNYDRWINGDCCCGGSNSVINPDCSKDCSCEAIYLEIDNLKTDVNVVSGEVEHKLDASAYTPVSLDGYATEQWVVDQGYVASLEGYVTEPDLTSYTYDKETIDQKVASGGTFDPSQYYTRSEIDAMLVDNANKTWVLNQGFATSSELIQYITNLQEQILSLQSAISGCCSSSGETIYRWITLTGDNDYVCSGTTKMTKEKKQQSTDNIIWTDVVPAEYRMGDTVLEENCADCGYSVDGFNVTLSDDTVISHTCEDLSTITCSGVTKYKLTHSIVVSGITNPSSVKRIDIGDCVDIIGNDAFSELNNLQKVVIPSSFQSKYDLQCDGIDVNAFEGTAIRTVGLQGSGADVEWNNNMEDVAEQMFKGCTALTTVELPSTFKEFQPQAFSGCTNLQSITIHSQSLPILNSRAGSHYQYDGLDDIGNNTFVIYVPSNMVNTYKNAVDSTGYRNWSKYASRIQAIQ